jgi:hypothetical protein
MSAIYRDRESRNKVGTGREFNTAMPRRDSECWTQTGVRRAKSSCNAVARSSSSQARGIRSRIDQA